jgi:copper ion binding protein
MSTITYSIPNISCNHCVHTIQSELGELAGVKSVKADAASKKVVVTFDAPATTDELVKVLTEINYPPAN